MIEKLNELRKRFIKEEFAILILLLIAVSMFISRPEVIGYASTNIHSQPLKLSIDRSQNYYLESYTPVHLNSLSISGKIIGKGTASIYLDNGVGKKVLVFTNMKKASARINRITGSIPSNGGVTEFSTVGISGLGVTADTLPAKQSPPTLGIIKGEYINDFDVLPPKYLAIEGVFTQACVESCILSTQEFTGSRFRLEFLIEPGTRLEITELIYTTFVADE